MDPNPPIINTTPSPAPDPAGYAPDPAVSGYPASAPAPNKKPSIAPLLIGIFVALAGVGFGIYEFLSVSEKDSTIKSLESQITALSSTIGSLNDRIAELEGSTPDKPTEETDVVYVKDRVLYAKNLGLKFTVPEELKTLAFKYTDTSVEILATTLADFTIDVEDPSQSTSTAYGTGIISVYENTGSEDPEAVKLPVEIGDKSFVYTAPQAVSSTETADIEVEEASANLIHKMLTENASAIEE